MGQKRLCGLSLMLLNVPIQATLRELIVFISKEHEVEREMQLGESGSVAEGRFDQNSSYTCMEFSNNKHILKIYQG